MKQAAQTLDAGPRVSLVGAGPGDPSLLTLAGLDRLRRADAVVYDALANPALLDHAPPHAQRINAGKRARKHRLTQDQIHAELLRLAQQGLRVVRLKGGDPYLFGRGAEEAVYLAARGVRVEVIPGITSGIAGPMAGGIPVTHRKLASTVTFVTGHEDPTKADTAVDYQALAALVAAGGTVCFYMGVGRLPLIAEQLAAHGLPRDTPAAAVQWGTLPTQKTARGTLASLHDRIQQQGLGAPAIIVVGPVAALDEPGLDFFTNPQTRPLLGQTVLVTRTRQQASGLRADLQALGANVIEAPTIRLLPPASWDEIDRAIRAIEQYDWLLLTSANGVEALADRLEAMGLDTRHLAGVRVAAIGEATAEALRDRLALRADLVPTRAVSESLAGELIAQDGIENMRGKRCLLLTADIARPDLPKALEQAGASVDVLTAYQTALAEALPDAAVRALADHAVDWVTFTSSSTARNLARLLPEGVAQLEGVRVASIGPKTSDTCRGLGLSVELEAASPGTGSLVDRLVRAVRGAAG